MKRYPDELRIKALIERLHIEWDYYKLMNEVRQYENAEEERKKRNKWKKIRLRCRTTYNDSPRTSSNGEETQRRQDVQENCLVW